MTLSMAETTAHHKLAAENRERAAKKNPKSQKPWEARRSTVKLSQNGLGEWFIRSEAGDDIPATDFEVSLWLDLQEAREIIRKLTGQE